MVISTRSAKNTKAWYVRRRKHTEKLAESIGKDPHHCSVCGKARTGKRSLHWHHRDPKTKLGQISQMYSRSDAVILAELRKCDRICKACHSHLHSTGGVGWVEKRPKALRVIFSFPLGKGPEAKRFRELANDLHKRLLEGEKL